MRRATISLLLLATISPIAAAQAPSPSRPQQKLDPDRLGMTCAQILKMTSAEWIAAFNDKAHVATPDASATLARATAVYGKCYDARTDSLAATLARSGKGPSKTARADFAGFETSLKDFGRQSTGGCCRARRRQKEGLRRTLRETVPLRILRRVRSENGEGCQARSGRGETSCACSISNNHSRTAGRHWSYDIEGGRRRD